MRPLINAVSFSASTIRSGNVAAAKIIGSNLSLAPIRAEAMSPGYIVDLLPERAEQDGELIVGVRIYRRVGVPRPLCLIRFSIGPATAVASITVRHA